MRTVEVAVEHYVEKLVTVLEYREREVVEKVIERVVRVPEIHEIEVPVEKIVERVL